MIQEVVNFMGAVLLARFVLNDVPHTLGLGNQPKSSYPVVAEAIVREGARKEAEWGIKEYGEKKWGKELWGKVTNSNITLFHGTSKFTLDDVLKQGLLPSYAGWFYELEEVEELPPEERPAPAVWLAYTPYLAFFFNDVAIQVTIPLSWVAEANDGVLVERVILPTMIDRYLLIEDWE